MMVEMEQPFVWPEEPKDLGPWDKEVFDMAQEERRELEDAYRPEAREQPTKERASMRDQARDLLEGREKWRSGNRDARWKDVGDEMEIETHVDVPRVER